MLSNQKVFEIYIILFNKYNEAFKIEDVKKIKDKHMKELKEVFQSCKESSKTKKVII